MRFLTISDIHFGSDRGHKKGSRAPIYLKQCFDAASAFGAKYILTLGDDPSGSAPEIDRENMARCAACFNDCGIPRISLSGNHDDRYVPRAVQAVIRRYPAQSHVCPGDADYDLIPWSPNTVAPQDGSPFMVERHHLDWLDRTLAEAKKKIILASHIPLSNPPGMKANHPAMRHFGYYKNGPEIQEILKSSKKIVLSLSGHHHREKLSYINDIPYFTCQSLVEKGSGANYLIDIRPNVITVESRRQTRQTMRYNIAFP